MPLIPALMKQVWWISEADQAVYITSHLKSIIFYQDYVGFFVFVFLILRF